MEIRIPEQAMRQGVLLHVCCAPCAGAIIEFLCGKGCRPVLFFSNSNIDTSGEFEKRYAEVLRYADRFSLRTICDPYDHENWLAAVKGLEDEPERGARCRACFLYRLTRSASKASELGLPAVTTSLASSRWKSLEQVDEAGLAACGPQMWWGQNWRKCGLQERRTAIIREQGFYNQNWCGCEFSHGQQQKHIL